MKFGVSFNFEFDEEAAKLLERLLRGDPKPSIADALEALIGSTAERGGPRQSMSDFERWAPFPFSPGGPGGGFGGDEPSTDEKPVRGRGSRRKADKPVSDA